MPVLDSVTAAFGMRLPLASSTVTVTVVVATPSAVTVVGLATTVDFAAEAVVPAVKATVVVSWAPPSVAVMVSLACAEVEDSVVVNTPCALVVPVVAPK